MTKPQLLHTSIIEDKDDWCRLVERYADGRKTCNCGEAYEQPRERTADGCWTPACRYGCSVNLLFARREIAGRVLAELEMLGSDGGG